MILGHAGFSLRLTDGLTPLLPMRSCRPPIPRSSRLSPFADLPRALEGRGLGYASSRGGPLCRRRSSRTRSSTRRSASRRAISGSTTDGITSEIVEEPPAAHVLHPDPAAQEEGRRSADALPGDWSRERMKDNDFINRVREHVAGVAAGRIPGHHRGHPRAARLLAGADREKPLFFCQIEALETAIFLAEVAGNRQPWIENKLREDGQPETPACTGSPSRWRPAPGKTVVMAMLIAWQALNKLANPQDKRFSDTFLVVTPGHHDPRPSAGPAAEPAGNYYQERDLADAGPAPGAAGREDRDHELPRASSAATRSTASATTKKVLAGPDGDLDQFKETPDQMVRRVCRSARHEEEHRRPQRRGPPLLPGRAAEPRRTKLSAEERAEAKRDEEGRPRLAQRPASRPAEAAASGRSTTCPPRRSSCAAPATRRGRCSRGSCSDFSLIDAIEAGIVKIPRVPVSDDAMAGDVADLPRPVGAHPGRPAEEGPRDGRGRGRAERCPRSSRAPSAASTATTRRASTAWKAAGTRHAAGVHRRLPEHEHQQDGVRLDRRLGEDRCRRHRTVPSRATCRSSATSRAALWIDAPEHAAHRLGPARVGRGDGPGVQEDRGRRDRRVQGRATEPLPGRSPGRDHRRGPPARGDEHHRQDGQAWASRSAASCRSRCSPRAGTPTPSPTSSASAPSGPSCSASRSSAAACGGSATSPNADGQFDPEYAEVYGVPFSFMPTERPGQADRPEGDPPRPGAARAERPRDHASRAVSATATTCRPSA